MSRCEVIEFSRYRSERAASKASAISARVCRHCGAAMADGENEDECSSAANVELQRPRGELRKFYAE